MIDEGSEYGVHDQCVIGWVVIIGRAAPLELEAEFIVELLGGEIGGPHLESRGEAAFAAGDGKAGGNQFRADPLSTPEGVDSDIIDLEFIDHDSGGEAADQLALCGRGFRGDDCGEDDAMRVHDNCPIAIDTARRQP